jgi:TAG lipase/steryl ester hydrolase/phospholipase A2/LPA acyltransferase
MKTRIALGKERQMAQAHDYASWRTHALDLDTMNGMDVWKADPNSPHYQYNLIQQRLINLRNWRKNGDWAQVVFALREGLQRNLGNLTNPELYKHTRVGTKYLIDEYLGEVVSTLNYLCDHEIADFPYAEKLLFFRHTGQSFGRSSLMLSGGANMGMFHVGVIKALFEQNLLPRVVSGSSAGSVVAAFIGTRKDSEFEGLFTGEAMDLKLWRRLGLREVVRQKSLMDGKEIERFLRNHIGELTFEEAFKRSGRIINITVSPVDKHQKPRLLNYLTAPHVLVWSAVLASCAVPGLFPAVMLMSKDRLGHEKPYLASTRWVDGAIQSDLPAQRLAELYNVNHHIVSQTNPHVVPFITDQYRKDNWTRFLTELFKNEIKFRSRQMLQLASYGIDRGIIKNLLEGAVSVVNQQYYGDITVHPRVHLRDYQHILGNMSRAEFQRWVHEGELATWPQITMIRDQTIIGQTLEDCIIRLKKQRNAATGLRRTGVRKASAPQAPALAA